MSRRPPTPIEIDRMAELRRGGMKIGEIANQVDRSEESVRRALVKTGETFPAPKPSPGKQGVPAEKHFTECWADRPRKKPERVRFDEGRAIELAERGVGLTAIASVVRAPYWQIEQVLVRARKLRSAGVRA